MNYIEYTNYVQLPDWANWMAKDGNGEWYFFEDKPISFSGVWVNVWINRYEREYAYTDPDGGDGWRESLTKIVR